LTDRVSRTVLLDGELTIQNIARVAAGLLTELSELSEQDELVLDLAGVEELDTAGLQMLMVLRAEADRIGRSCSLVGPSEAVLRILEIVHLDQALQPAVRSPRRSVEAAR
jgi:anti-sigma B factor antagonist